MTVNDQLPTIPPTVARIDAVPGATAVTTPLVDIVAKMGFADVHVTGKPVITVPAASLAVAVAWAVWPTSSVAESMETETVATVGGGGGGGGGAVMGNDALPDTPLTVA